MMTSALLLSLMLCAAPRQVGGERALYIPSLARLAPVTAMADRAGMRSVLLRPSTWGPELLPNWGIDVTRPQQLRAAGIDPEGSLTVSSSPLGQVACLSLEDPTVFGQHGSRRLAGLGKPWSGKERGVPLTGVALEGKVVAGYVVRGKEACIVGGQSVDAVAALAAAARELLSRPAKPSKKLSAPAYLIGPGSTQFELGTESDGFLLVGESVRPPGAPRLAGAGPSPYAKVAPSGLLTLSARLQPSALPEFADIVTGWLTTLCADCDRPGVSRFSTRLTSGMTGNVLLRVDAFKLSRGTMRSPAGKYFAARHAYVLELSRPKDAARLLESLDSLVPKGTSGISVSRAGQDWVLSVPGGELRVGLYEGHLYFGNDEAALRAALAVIPESPGSQPHAVVFEGDPRALRRALAQVSLGDVLASEELAGLFAASTELGPLLGITSRLSGFVDPASEQLRLSFLWQLSPPEEPSGNGAGKDGGR